VSPGRVSPRTTSTKTSHLLSPRLQRREASRRWSRGDSKWLVFVDVVRGLTRPGLTFLFVGLVGVIYFTLGGSDMEILDIRPRIIDTVLYLATACVLWWFGARQIAKRREGEVPR